MLQRYYLKWCLFLLIATLITGVAKAQDIPEWKRGTLGNDQDGNRIVYWQDFEDIKTPYAGSPKVGQAYVDYWEKDKIGVKPTGWIDCWESGTFQKSSNNVYIKWEVKAQGGKNQPRRSYGVQGEGRGLHLRYFAYDDKAFSAVILPAIDLRKRNAKSPTLKFQFASPQRTQCDKLVIKYRIEKFGSLGGWRELVSYQEQNEEFVQKAISLADAFKKHLNTKTNTYIALSDDQLAKVELYFEGHTKLGGGLNVDDIMVVDVNDNPLKVGQYELQQLTTPVGKGTNLNELARISFDVTAGYGFYKLDGLELPFVGTASDVASFSLYHTATPYFSSLASNKFCDLIITGNTIKLNNVPDDEAHRILPGSHHFWVVANIASSATLKNKISVKFPVNAVKLKAFNEIQAGTISPLTVSDRSFPAVEQYDEHRFCTVYECLMSEDFETNAAQRWTLSESWKIGKPVRNLANTTYKTAPTEAFSGENVLATGTYSEKEADHIDGSYDDNKKFSQTRVTYKVDAGIQAEFIKDVRFKAKYCLNSKPDDKFRLVVITDADPTGGVPVDVESVVWENVTRTVMSGWNTMNVDLSKVATRNKKFRLRFEFETKTDGEAESGLFLDDIQVLGDLIKKDIGIVNIETPKGFDLVTAPLKVKVKNYGKEQITGGYKLKVTLNGIEHVFPFNDVLAPGAEMTHSLSGLNLAPDVDKAISNEKHIIVEVILNTEPDDETSNNTQTTRFYSYPTYDIQAGVNTKRYPVKDRFDRLMHWYPEAAGVLYSSSWTETFVDTQAKFKDKPKYTTNVPYSYQVWTTGLPQCNLNEQSTLTGPIFNLEGPEKKEFIVGYIYEKDVSQTPATFYFEYSTDGKQWQVLKKNTTIWSDNWYDSDAGWVLNDEPEAYRIAKIELPIATGKIQIRAHFKGALPYAGVTISGFEVREMRRDFQVTAITPNADGTNCDLIGTQKLKIKVKNNGPVATTAQEDCPVTVRVYEYPNQASYTTKVGLTLMGEHLFTLPIPALAPGNDHTLETEISYPWDVSNWGYHVEVVLAPKVDDENTTNNTFNGDVVSMAPYFSIIQNMVRSTSPIFYANLPTMVMLDVTSANASHFDLSVDNWTITPNNAGSSTGQSANFTANADVQLAYKVRSSYPPYSTKVCSKTLNFKVVDQPDDLQNISVKYVEQEGDGLKGCYKASGESIKVTTTAHSDVQKASVDVYINGVLQTGLAITPVNPQMDKTTTTTFTINGVKIPAGYSQIEIVPVSINDDGTHSNLSQQTNIYRENRLYRAVVPENFTVYWRNSALATAITPIPAGGTVNNFVGKVTLYVPPVNGATYQWYKGNVEATQFSDLRKIEGETGNEFNVPDESAAYAVEISYSSCGRVKPSYLVFVRTDDLEMVAFNGAALSGVCAAQGKLPLLVDIRNNSRTEYPVGTKLRFKLKVTPRVTPPPSGITPYDGTFDYSLTTTMSQQAVNTLEIITLNSTQYASGENDIELEFLGIVSGSTLVKDGNLENNKLKKRVGVNPSPEVAIMPALVKQKFSASENYEITPTYSGSSPAIRYEWASKNDEDHDFTNEAGETPNFTINGTPKDEYRVTAYNAQGCASTAIVKFVQTDLELTNIVSPVSACDLGQVSYDFVDIAVTNTGSKKIRNLDAKIKAVVHLNGAQVKVEELDIPSALREVNGAMNLRVSVAGLKNQLSSGNSHQLKVQISLVGGEDVVATNNMQEVALRSYGNPDFSMQYDLQDALGGTPTTTAIEAGSKVEYYANKESDFRFHVSGYSDASYEWAYSPDNTLAGISDIITGDENNPATQFQLTGETVKLPNWNTKARSKDKAGSGFYYLTMRTLEGCSTRKSFELVVIRQDIEIIGVQAPVSACDFAGNKTVTVSVSNVGSRYIPMNANLKVDVEIHSSKEFTTSTKKSTYTKEYLVDTDWQVGSAISIPVSFDYSAASWKADGRAFYIKATVEFTNETQKKLEFLTDNNVYKYEELTLSEPTPGTPDYEAENKKYQAALARSRCFFADWQDVNVERIKVSDDEPSNATLEMNGTYKYSFTTTGGQTNYVTLDADKNDCTYVWSLGYGITRANDSEGNPLPTDQQTIKVNGVGKFELLLATRPDKLVVGQTIDKACKATFTGYLATAGNDIVILSVDQPDSEACVENSQNAQIIFTMRNNAPIAIASSAGAEDPKITFTYRFTNSSNTALLDGSHTATLKEIITRFNSDKPELKPDPLELPEKADFKVNLSALAGISFPHLTEPGNYKLEISFTVDDRLKDFDNAQTNRMEHQITYLGEPRMEFQDLGGANRTFYASSAILQLDPNKLETDYLGYKNFVWTKPDGGSVSGTRLSVIVPGDYRFSYSDRAGCTGSRTIKVNFPGYLQFAPNAIISPVEGCDILNTQPVVKFRVKNEGKEPFTVASTGIPILTTLVDPYAPDPNATQTQSHLLAKGESNTIAPGETAEVTTTAPITFSPTVNNTWNLKLDLESTTDGSHAAGIDHPAAESQVFDNPIPRKPDLRAQAEAYLQSQHVSPINLEEIPRDIKFTLDAFGNTTGETYVWTTPENYSGPKDASSLQFYTSGTYKVKVTSDKGCIAEAEEVKLLYKVEFTLLPVLNETLSSFCVKNGVATSEYIVKVKVTVEKADEPIPAGTDLKFTYRVTNAGVLVTEKTETLTTQEDLTVGKILEYTFTQPVSMPRGTNKIELTYSFEYFGKPIPGVSSITELRYVEGPAITINPRYEDNKPVTLQPIVTGGTAPYKYTWNGQEAGSTYEVEGGMMTIIVTDVNGCSDEATTEVLVYHTLSVEKAGEGDLRIQMYKDDGVQLETPLLNNGDRIYHGRKMRIFAIPSSAKKAILEYLIVNEQKIPVDKTGKEYIMEKISGNVKVEVRFKSEQNVNPGAVEDPRLAEVLCVSPVASHLFILHTESVVAYDVLSITGVKVASGKNTAGADQIVLDASALRPAVYIVRVYSDTGAVRTLKVVKE